MREGKHLCFVRTGGKNVPTEVEIGGTNDHYVEIKKGLKESDLVLLFNPTSAETSAPAPASPSPAAAAALPAVASKP